MLASMVVFDESRMACGRGVRSRPVCSWQAEGRVSLFRDIRRCPGVSPSAHGTGSGRCVALSDPPRADARARFSIASSKAQAPPLPSAPAAAWQLASLPAALYTFNSRLSHNMRSSLGSHGGSSRPMKASSSKERREAPSAVPPPPGQTPLAFDDESSGGEDDDDNSESGAELPELLDDEEDEFEEDRQRTTGVAMWEDDEGKETDGSSVEASEASDLDEEEEEDGDEAPRLSASSKGKARDREMVSVLSAKPGELSI